MSRTRRRKNAQHLSFVPDLDKVDSWDKQRYQSDNPHIVRKRAFAHFHADNHPGVWTAPSWYRRVWNREEKREAKRELHRCLRQAEWEDHLPHRKPESAGWCWF